MDQQRRDFELTLTGYVTQLRDFKKSTSSAEDTVINTSKMVKDQLSAVRHIYVPTKLRSVPYSGEYQPSTSKLVILDAFAVRFESIRSRRRRRYQRCGTEIVSTGNRRSKEGYDIERVPLVGVLQF